MTPSYLRTAISMLISAGFFKRKMADKYGRAFGEQCMNVCHQRKFYFVHNPKCGGTSIKDSLGMDERDGADHRTPTQSVHPRTWESYFTFVVVRHPIDRLRSSWKYHTNPSYTGVYYKHNPNLRNLELDEYFYTMKDLKYCIIPQWRYTYHEYSGKNIDFICKMETLASDFEQVFRRLNIPDQQLSRLNSSRNKPGEDILSRPSSFQSDVLDFYEEDFQLFGYKDT